MAKWDITKAKCRNCEELEAKLAMTEQQNKEPGTMVVANIVEHEDGSATYTFDMDKSASTKITELGLEVALTCAAYTIDVQDALEAIRAYAREKHNDEG